ncbi:MAG: PAS domain S-box protein, partial [Chitinophagaceae bacterium]
MDNRYKKINRLLSAYSKGDFDKAIPLSGTLDGLDAIISGINMLGEELKAVTISRDYFNNIFNTVSDMVLLVDSRGIIRDLNKAVYHQLGYSKTELSGKPVSCLQTTGNKSLSTGLLKEVRSGKGIMQMDTFFKDIHHKLIPVQITVTVMVDPSRKIHILITAKDNTGRIQNENAVIRAIIDAQEKERQRIAKDIHDSLGQQLSAIKFYIGALAEKCKDVGQRKNLLVSNTALVKVISEIRNICFDLVPSTLGEFGLWQAVKELCHQPEYKGKLQFILKEEPDFPSLPTNLEIDIF